MYIQKVPKNQNKFEKKYFFVLSWRSGEGHRQKEQDLDPDPYQNITDPEPWIQVN
jgi:hypothetical protein